MYTSVQGLHINTTLLRAQVKLTDNNVRISLPLSLEAYLPVSVGDRIDLLADPDQGLRLVKESRSASSLQKVGEEMVSFFDYNTQLDPFVDRVFELALRETYVDLLHGCLLCSEQKAEVEEQAVVASEETEDSQDEFDVTHQDFQEALTHDESLPTGVSLAVSNRLGSVPDVRYTRRLSANAYPVLVVRHTGGEGEAKNCSVIAIRLDAETFHRMGISENEELSSQIFCANGRRYVKVYRSSDTKNAVHVYQPNGSRFDLKIPVQENSPILRGVRKGVPVTVARIGTGFIRVELPYPEEAYSGSGVRIADVIERKSNTVNAETLTV